MEEFRRMILKVSDVSGSSATIPVTNDHTDGSWLITDIYEGELFLNIIDNVLQTRTEAGIINLNSASSSDADRVIQDVKFDEGVEKGEPLIITGYNVGSGIITVAKADASNSTLMPSYGLAMANYSSGATGQMVTVGTLTDVDTSAFTEGQTLYVGVGGGLTNIKPIEPNLIQNVGIVARSNANNGSIEVVAIGRSNDVPNLPVGHTFIGTATNPTTIDLTTELNDKQDTLVSGTNIKTVGGTTILGSGNIDLGVTSILAGTNITINPVGGVGAVTINASGGGGGAVVSELIQSLDTVDLILNQWAVADDNNNWKSQSLNSTAGFVAEPSLWFKNRFYLKDKDALSNFYLHWTTANIGGEYEIYVASFDFSTSLFLNNKQILVNETFTAMGGAPFKKTDFVIATNTLNADSILFVSIRALNSDETIKGLTMYYEFYPPN